MNLDLETRLQACGVSFSRLPKADKVKLLARWTKEFPELVESARRGQKSPNVARDKTADLLYMGLRDQAFFVLPDDRSGMPSCYCRAEAMPDVQELTWDSITSCDELVIVSSDFQWSAVFVNHGSPQFVGRHFQSRRESA
jgi:hypothetical protein